VAFNKKTTLPAPLRFMAKCLGNVITDAEALSLQYAKINENTFHENPSVTKLNMTLSRSSIFLQSYFTLTQDGNYTQLLKGVDIAVTGGNQSIDMFTVLKGIFLHTTYLFS
jgi:hypothetical protein